MTPIPTIRRAGALAGAVAAVLAAAPAAGAATLQLDGDTLVYAAAGGVENRPSFSQPVEGTLRVSDDAEHLSGGAGCTVLDPEYPTQADCPVPARLRVVLGDGNDRVMLRESLPPIAVSVLGEAGDDVLEANADVDNRVVLDGGDGADSLTGYAFADTLLGGTGDDVLSGGAAGDVLRGGEGDDALEPDTWVDVQGDDVVDGGPGFDRVHDWGSTSTLPGYAVAISVDGAAGDGRPGESDNVTAVERFDALTPGRYVLADSADSIDLPNYGSSSVAGNGGGDTVTGNDGSEQLDGGPGDDRLEGGFGHDTLTGGPGRDTIFGDETSQRCSYGDECTVVPYGNDTISARDGEADTVDCGVGDDRAVVDQVDVVANCEIVDRGASPTPRSPTPRASIALARSVGLRGALRRGLPIRVAGLPAGRHTVVVRFGRRVVARSAVQVGASGSATTRVRIGRTGKRLLMRRSRARLVLRVGTARATVTLSRAG